MVDRAERQGLELAAAPRLLRNDRCGVFEKASASSYLLTLAIRHSEDEAIKGLYLCGSYILPSRLRVARSTIVRAERGLMHGGALALRALILTQSAGVVSLMDVASFEIATGVANLTENDSRINAALAIRLAAQKGLNSTPGLARLASMWSTGQADPYPTYFQQGLGLVVQAAETSVREQMDLRLAAVSQEFEA